MQQSRSRWEECTTGGEKVKGEKCGVGGVFVRRGAKKREQGVSVRLCTPHRAIF